VGSKDGQHDNLCLKDINLTNQTNTMSLELCSQLCLLIWVCMNSLFAGRPWPRVCTCRNRLRVLLDVPAIIVAAD
jgi:hypothetical protein